MLEMNNFLDSRKVFILNVSENYFDNHTEEFRDQLLKNKDVDRFLDDCVCSLLFVDIRNSNLIVKTQILRDSDMKNALVFYKNIPSIITDVNIKDVLRICSLQNPPIDSFYSVLQNVYLPALFEDENTMEDIKLRSLFENMEEGIRSAVMKKNLLPNSSPIPAKPLSLSGILNLKDEYNYWNYISLHSKNPEDSIKAQKILPVLQQLGTKLSQSNQIDHLDDLCEDAYNAFDDIWKMEKCDFPEDNMINLFDIVGNFICHQIQTCLNSKQIWTDSYYEVNELMLTCSEICCRWIDSCTQLTTIFWPHYVSHSWTRGKYEPTYVKNFVQRLHEIRQVRSVHETVCQILSKTEREKLKVFDHFKVFSQINAIQYNPYTEPMWQAALKSFNENLKPIHEYVAKKIEEKLKYCSTNVLQLLEWFKKYKNLMEKEEIKTILKTQRQNFLILLQDYINELSSSDFSSFDVITEKFPTDIFNIPEIVLKMIRLKEIGSRLKDIESNVLILLNDLNNYDKLRESVITLKKELQITDSSYLNDWSSNTLRLITNSEISLRTGDPVVYFEQNKLMVVNFNPKLVKLVEEVHQLRLLGYSIPLEIIKVVDKAKLFMRQAKALEQVANFHNTIGDRMIPSQRPMMLSLAVELSKLVRSENSVTWSDTNAVEQYIGKLQSIVDQLAAENNRLYFYHSEVLKKVTSLIDSDLMQQKNIWKEVIREIRIIIAGVISKFAKAKTWLIHLDHQIYKVLQYRYQAGLFNLSQQLPEIKIELVYRQQKLQFNPPMEEIKMKYYSQVKRFIILPLSFQGVSDSSESIFPVMVVRNADYFQQVYINADHTFEKLLSLRDQWIDKTSLGAIDLENAAREHIKTADDWDHNFRSSKAWGQEIAKIIDCEHKVDCFIVSTAPVRSEIELHNNRYWDVLSISLYASISFDANTVEEFITSARKRLQYHPQTFDEIGEASEAYYSTVQKSTEIQKVVDEMEKKNRVLSSWTKEYVNQAVVVKQTWNNFQAFLDNQQFHINRQVESIKSKLAAEMDNLSSELEKFILRWERIRPKETDLVDGNYSMVDNNLAILKEKREEWNVISDNLKKIIKDYERFDIELPEFPDYQKFEDDLKECEEIWGLYEKFSEGLKEFATEEWTIFRSRCVGKFEFFLTKWEEKLSGMSVTPLTARLMTELRKYKDFMPQIKFLRGDVFSNKHWTELCALLKLPLKPVEKLTFGDFLSAQDLVMTNLDAIQELNNRASGEAVIRQALAELDIWEVESKFSFILYHDSKGEEVHLIKDFKDILSKVGDNQCLLQSMIGSPNYEHYRDLILIWESKLNDVDYYLRSLSEIQRKWLYLEPIFKSESMTLEKARFERIDKDFRLILFTIFSSDQRVVSLYRMPNLKSALDMLVQQLAICQKSLNEYLEEKRLKFPRFYFLSDDDLLEILGQANKPEIVQSHLKKLFAGIHSVIFDNKSIIAVKSLEGETLTLENSVTISLDVENWLSSLSVEVSETLKQLLIACLKEADLIAFPSQILCLAKSISFTRNCEDSIKTGKLKSLESMLEKELETYTKLDLDLENTDDSVVVELKLKALIFETIYRMDVVRDLIENSVSSVDEWNWQKRVRFYLNKNNSLIIRMVDAEFNYSYEYQGNAPKLVHTPLTDRCYLTLTQAMSMGLGGNPYGPAGTGKTESVKALGRLFGRQVLVFNCDEGLDITSLTRILIGLVKCGAWGCFDEFNRLEEATLSAVSTHIHIIQEALRSGLKNIVLMNRQIELNPDTGIFVTMNPAGRTYGGRQKLPDNLKQLFRPIAMSQPDELQIAEVILYSEGFKNAKLIARKLVQIFDTAKKTLSQQKHYDWGLRALKTVVGGCKAVLKSMKSTQIVNINELSLVVYALRLNTLSKLTFSDSQQFDELISCTFQDVEFNVFKDDSISAAIENSFHALGLQFNARQVQKSLELFEQLEQRMGVVIVGPSGSGKSTICKILKQALTNRKRVINQYTINPKSISRTQLLGQIDPDTRQWMNGVLSTIAQRVFNESPDVESWIVFDGDIDPEWIESLNSVLDDNRLLTLPSGWRIHFGPNVHFLFETHSLQHASPATVSRMGIILLSEEDMDLKCIVESWLQKQSDNERIKLSDLIEKYFYRAVQWIKNKGEIITNISASSLVRNCLSLMNNVMNKTKFCVILINGLGSTLTLSSKVAFSKQVLEWTEEFVPDSSKLLYYDENRACIEYYLTEYSSTASIVKTAQVKLCIEVLKVWLNKQEPFIMIGPQGCGKNQILNYCIQEMRGMEIVTVYCSSQITPGHVLEKLSQGCMLVTSNNGYILRPKTSDNLILHIKDLNLVNLDKWGSNMLVSFLQQIITYHGYYDPVQMEWIHIERILVVCSLLSCENLSPRFINCNHLISLESLDHTDLQAICTFHLRTLSLTDKLQPVVLNIIIDIYMKLKETFSSGFTNDNEFNLLDLCNWCNGMRRYTIKTNQDIIQALLYEVSRLFSDRLINENDKQKFCSIIKAGIDAELGHVSIVDEHKDIVFFCEDSANESCGGNLNSINLNDWISLLEKRINLLENEGEFNDRKILLPELAKMVVYFERVLTFPGLSLFLPGYSGFGRKSAVRVVAARQSARYFSPKVSATYGINQFKNDMKLILQLAGLENQTVYFVLEDFQIICDAMYDFVNSFLASGEIPGLYQVEEFQAVCSPLKEVTNQHNFQGTECQFFTERVKKNVHVIIIADLMFTETSNRWTNNPIIRRRCQTIWQSDWSIETKYSILKSTLKKHSDDAENSLNDAEDEISDSVLRYFLEINEDAKTWMTVTPRHFAMFLKTYREIKENKRTSIVDSEQRLKAGLAKLTEAKSVVAQLKEDAAKQESKLAEKRSKANAALELITKTMQSASFQKTEMETLKENIEKENDALASRKEQIDAELAEVEPVLAEARSAVGNIKSESLSEIRSLRAPPDVIHDILEGVLRLMGIQDTSWNSMKTFLAKRGVKEDIRYFDARSIFTENRLQVEELLRQRAKSFDEKTAKRASAAAAPLAAWVIANVKYSKILEKIRPLELEQTKLQQKLKQSQDEILLLSSGLENVEQTVHDLKEQLNVNTKEAAEIEIHLAKVQSTIAAAEGLVLKLDDEYSRWSERVIELSTDLMVLTHNCLLSSAVITYLPHSSEEIRRSMLDKWQNMMELKKFELEKFLSSEQEQLRWLSEGLPSDYLSIQNAVIISQLSQMDIDVNFTPFFIDPSDIVLKWLENLLKRNKTVDTVLSHSQRLYTSLELAIRFGKALIICDINNLDPILVPILRRNYLFQGTRKLIQVGDKLVDYNPGFQLYLISRNANMNMPSYFTSLFSSVNFEITYSRLSQQLLRCALSVEKPELEKRRIQLLKKEEELKLKLFTLQDNILIELANAQGNVLENKELLSTLNETKKHSIGIKSSLIESKKIQTDLLNEYEMYKPLAEKAATLYFCTLSLKSVNILYQISMDAFIKIYQNIFSSPEEEVDFNIERRLHKLIRLSYHYISRFLFKEDLLTFSLHLIHNMHPDLFQHNEWELFNREILVNYQADSPEVLNTTPTWASTEQAFDIFLLKLTLPTLYKQLDVTNEKCWELFMKKPSYELDIAVSNFQKILVVQAFKPGYLYSALMNFVQKVLGLQSLTVISLEFDQLLPHTNAKEPILIIISPGIDPSEELRSFAKANVGSKFREIALGRGQADPATAALIEMAQNGGWLILKNLHLMTSWLPTLEKEFRSLSDVDDNFRLWLTSESHPNFPSTFIQSCLKITNEIPQGMKKNLERTYSKLTKEPFPSVEYARCIFILSWFHAIVQERRTYIPQGWCKFYEFNDSDLFAALKVIQKRFKSDHINLVKWNYLYGLFEQAIYGGRIDNFQDLNVLKSYLRTYFNYDVINTGKKTLAPNIHVPESSHSKEYSDMIQNLCETNSPKFFALPLNVELSWQKKRSSDVITWLKILKRQNIITNKLNNEEKKKKISPVLHLWKQLNQEVNILKMKTVLGEQTEQEPIRKFLAQEINFAIRLANHIHRTLVDVNKTVRSSSQTNESIIPLMTDITNHRTPDDWLSVWEGNSNLIMYIRSVMNRASSIIKLRNDNNTIEEFISVPVDLKKFFNPQIFLSIFKQYSSRLNGISLDELQLECSWKNYISGSRVTLKVEGLLMEGAYIDTNGTLHENLADSPVLSRVPNCHMAWMSEEFSNNNNETVLRIPVYHNATREDTLMFIKVPISFQEYDKWIQTNAAFYLQE